MRILYLSGSIIPSQKANSVHVMKMCEALSLSHKVSLIATSGGNEDAYKYLIESIRMFPDQDQLSSMLIKSKFERVKYRNLSKGIASLHSGWKF
mgnify:CR=1 FL=1